MGILIRKAGQAQADKDLKDWGSLTWLASGNLENAEGVTVGRVVIKKGQANPPHAHNNCEEVLYLLHGRLEHWVGDEMAVMEPGDTITIPAGVKHNARSIGDEDAEMMVVYASAYRDMVEIQFTRLQDTGGKQEVPG